MKYIILHKSKSGSVYILGFTNNISEFKNSNPEDTETV